MALQNDIEALSSTINSRPIQLRTSIDLYGNYKDLSWKIEYVNPSTTENPTLFEITISCSRVDVTSQFDGKGIRIAASSLLSLQDAQMLYNIIIDVLYNNGISQDPIVDVVKTSILLWASSYLSLYIDLR